MAGFPMNSRVSAYKSAAIHGGVAAADPHGMVLLLLNAAAERMNSAAGSLERGEIVAKARLLHSCVTLIGELRGVLNTAEGGEVARNLSDLYDYMARRLLVANAENSLPALREVQGLLDEIRSAWMAIGPEVRQPGATRAAV